MKTLERLRFAIEAMKQANIGHCHEIFMDIELHKKKEEISFDVLLSHTHHVSDLVRLFNLSYFSEPAGDKIKQIILP